MDKEPKLLVLKTEANEISAGKAIIRQYFPQVLPTLDLSTVVIKGTHPEDGGWLRNNIVDEMYFVISGTGRLLLGDGTCLDLIPESAALIHKGTKFRVEDAKDLYIVVITSPAWNIEQYEHLQE